MYCCSDISCQFFRESTILQWDILWPLSLTVFSQVDVKVVNVEFLAKLKPLLQILNYFRRIWGPLNNREVFDQVTSFFPVFFMENLRKYLPGFLWRLKPWVAVRREVRFSWFGPSSKHWKKTAFLTRLGKQCVTSSQCITT